jgi:AraC-like DNA-binding protein
VTESYRERRAAALDATLWSRTADGSAGWVLPDGCLDVLWDGRELLVAGPDTAAHRSGAPAGLRYTAVRFDSGVGPAVLHLPADAVRDQRVPLVEVLPRPEVERLAEDIAAAADPGTVLERWAARRLGRGPGPDATLRRVADLLDGGLRVADVADAVGLGERQLHRRSLAAFGYGPKVLARIRRLQRALALARGGTAFARTAAEAGYADQAHLAREVRALAGRPLSELVDRWAGTPDPQAGGRAAKTSTPLPSGSRRLA